MRARVCASVPDEQACDGGGDQHGEDDSQEHRRREVVLVELLAPGEVGGEPDVQIPLRAPEPPNLPRIATFRRGDASFVARGTETLRNSWIFTQTPVVKRPLVHVPTHLRFTCTGTGRPGVCRHQTGRPENCGYTYLQSSGPQTCTTGRTSTETSGV